MRGFADCRSRPTAYGAIGGAAGSFDDAGCIAVYGAGARCAAMENRQPATPLELEGLVLSDADGAFYEVPRVVIERYRVTDERAAELAAELTDDVIGMSLSLAWRVTRALYAARAPLARVSEP
jgi:hypothetical protein